MLVISGALRSSSSASASAVSADGTASRAAEALHLSPRTIRYQLKTAYRKLGVHTMADAIRAVTSAGLLPASPPSTWIA